MNTQEIRQLIDLCEERLPSAEYEDSATEVIAILHSYDSQVYTKLAQKVQRIETLEAEIKQLKAEVKDETRGLIANLFDALDVAKTRVVRTVSFIFKLTKDPKPTETPKYKEILSELEQHLTPELIVVLDQLKKQMVTVTQKAPAMTIKPIDEGIVGSIFTRLKNAVLSWGQRYDQKLNKLEQIAFRK